MAKSPSDSVMTIVELSKYLKISRSTLYKLAQEGKVPGQKVGRHWRFHKAVIDRWLGDRDNHGTGKQGAKAAYEYVKNSDQQRTAPGTQIWEKLIGDDAALLMIDEIAYYLRVARGAQYQAGRTSVAEQTVAFLMSLIKFASESKRTVLVYTLADSADAFGKESDDLREELSEARSVSARQEHVLTPTAEDEISAIVTHRLFAKVDRKRAEETATEWTKYSAKLIDQGIDLPQRAVRAEYQNEIVQDYPFHPELLTTLNRKTSTIPNFQRTRGVLRLLAQTVRELWQTKPKDCYLICPHHLNLADEHVANDLTSRLDRPQFKQVIEADIASPKTGTLSHAQEIDLEWTEAGKPPYPGETNQIESRCLRRGHAHARVRGKPWCVVLDHVFPHKEPPMNFVGVDLHKKTAVVCVVSQARQVLETRRLACAERRIRSLRPSRARARIGEHHRYSRARAFSLFLLRRKRARAYS